MSRWVPLCLLLADACIADAAQNHPLLGKSFRRPQKNGWIYVHLEGSARQIGFQHGYWLAKEIQTALKTIAYEMKHDTEKDWSFYRQAAEQFSH